LHFQEGLDWEIDASTLDARISWRRLNHASTCIASRSPPIQYIDRTDT
jgi:hypothetical protein